MRSKYFKLLMDNNIPDYFKELDDVKYSRKYKLLSELLSKYNRKHIVQGLHEYYENHIRLNNVNLSAMNNIIENIIKRKSSNENN